MDEPAEPPKANSHPQGELQRSRISLPIIVGVLLGIALSLYLVRQFYADPLPSLAADDLRHAEAAWRTAAIRDYDVEVEVQARQRETYAVEVRDGTPQQAWRNGKPLKQIRTFDTWTVPGMFDTIHSDFDRADRKNEPAPELILRAVFDQRTGVPLRYKRIQWGADLEISWQVTKFESK
jgi:hypothetical protein